MNNKIEVNLPRNRNIKISDTLSCRKGIRNYIEMKNEDELIKIDCRIDPDGRNELKVYKNGILAKHVVNGKSILEEQKNLALQESLNDESKNKEGAAEKLHKEAKRKQA